MKGQAILFAVLGAGMILGAAAAVFWGISPGGFGWGVALPIAVPLGITGVIFLFVARFMAGLDLGGSSIPNGVPATAQILSVQDTGVTINEVNLMVKLGLRVTVEGAPPYEVEAKTLLPGRTSWSALQPGMTIPVKVDPRDPSRVAVDFGGGLSARQAPPEMLAQAINTALASGPAGAQQAGMVSMKAADIIRDGVPTHGRLVSVTPTGLTADKAAAGLAPAEADDPLVLVAFTFTGDGGAEQSGRCVVRVPDGKAGFLAAGVEIPVAYLPGRPETATIDWTRLT